jgi:hypothetical protein
MCNTYEEAIVCEDLRLPAAVSCELAGDGGSKPLTVVESFGFDKARKGVSFVGGATGSERGKEISYRRYLQRKTALQCRCVEWEPDQNAWRLLINYFRNTKQQKV